MQGKSAVKAQAQKALVEWNGDESGPTVLGDQREAAFRRIPQQGPRSLAELADCEDVEGFHGISGCAHKA